MIISGSEKIYPREVEEILYRCPGVWEAAVAAAMARISADQSVRVAIRTGGGKSFSSGGNLKHTKNKHGSFEGDAVSVKNGYRVGIQRVARAM